MTIARLHRPGCFLAHHERRGSRTSGHAEHRSPVDAIARFCRVKAQIADRLACDRLQGAYVDGPRGNATYRKLILFGCGVAAPVRRLAGMILACDTECWGGCWQPVD